jgi:peptide/nickel transport system permease protein
MAKRLLTWFATSVVLLFVISALVFVLISLTPGDAAQVIVGPQASIEKYQAVREQLGLDLPIWQQYWNWLSGVLHGDFGRSLVSNVPITTILADRIEPTLALMGAAFVCAAALGLVLGVVSASKGGAVAKAADIGSVIGLALPSFWVGLVLAAVVSVEFRLLPLFGYSPIVDGFGDWLKHMILPIATITLGSMALLAKQTRDAVSEQLAQPYVLLLRAHGVPERTIVWKHALRNALVPIVTILGMKVIGLTSGTVLIETVFAIPGLGSYSVQSAQAHDLPVVQTITLLFTVMIIVTNLVVELVYAKLNVKEA